MNTDTNPHSRGPNMGGLTATAYPLKQTQALRLWREHKQNLAKFKDTTFQLLAHPDATPEMIEVIRTKAILMHKQHLDTLNKMRAAGFNVD